MHHQCLTGHVSRLGSSSRASQTLSQLICAAGIRASNCASTRRRLATLTTSSIPQLHAPDLLQSPNSRHISRVHSLLRDQGILKITLGSLDAESTYLRRLIVSLAQHHGHELPISHSASRGWFWDVRPSQANFQTANHQARSETMEEFPWHTDCSYEDPTPRFFALQVLQHDRFGGGTLSVMNVARLLEHLSPRATETLARPEFRITIPKEFIKDPAQTSIVGSLLVSTEPGKHMMRFRHDILTPLTDDAASALQELQAALRAVDVLQHAMIQLTPGDLPSRSVVLVDNWRWLHARNDIKDPERHLRRVRWDAVPFGQSFGQSRSRNPSSDTSSSRIENSRMAAEAA